MMRGSGAEIVAEEKVNQDCKRTSPLRGRLEAWRDVVKVDNRSAQILTGEGESSVTHGFPDKIELTATSAMTSPRGT